MREIFARYDIHSKYIAYEQSAMELVKKEIESDHFPVPELIPVFLLLCAHRKCRENHPRAPNIL